jgi:hypothetical protein
MTSFAKKPDRARAGRLGKGWVAIALTSLILGCPATLAGGSGERVTIVHFDSHGADYTLLVVPEKSDPPDVYMGACARFEVRGTYRRLKGSYFQSHPLLSRQAHLKALEYLQRAFSMHQVVNLGWMGTGFEAIDPASPCVVRSRALVLLEDPKHRTWVVSFHDET